MIHQMKRGKKFLSLQCLSKSTRRPKKADFYRRCGICYILFSFTFYPPKPVTNYRVGDSCVSGVVGVVGEVGLVGVVQVVQVE